MVSESNKALIIEKTSPWYQNRSKAFNSEKLYHESESK